jgi:hypothetical protein
MPEDLYILLTQIKDATEWAAIADWCQVWLLAIIASIMWWKA